MKKIFALLFFISNCALANQVKMLDVKLEAARPGLIGGRIARDGELPFSVFIQNCSASLVGPEVILTAGHCRGNNEQVAFNFEGRRFEGRCRRHPDFSEDRNNFLNNDFSLCKFSPAINNALFGDLSPVSVNSGDNVTLQGFGQNRLGTLQVGEARVDQINNKDIQVKSSVKLGGGDSGGGLLLGTPDLERGPFQIIGVNSRVEVNGNTSFFNRVNLNRSQDFFRDFADDNNVEICGINSNCQQNNNDRCDAERDIVKFFEDELQNAKNVLNDCLRGN